MGAPDASAETAGAAACSPVATTYPATSADDEDGDWRFAGDASRSARAGARLSTFQGHVLRPGENHATGDHQTTSSAGGIGGAAVGGEFSVLGKTFARATSKRQDKVLSRHPSPHGELKDASPRRQADGIPFCDFLKPTTTKDERAGELRTTRPHLCLNSDR